MYKIKVIYDTGDSFHREYGVEDVLSEMAWKSLENAQQALRDIEAHYSTLKQIKHEFDLDDQDIKVIAQKAKEQPWYCHDKQTRGRRRCQLPLG